MGQIIGIDTMIFIFLIEDHPKFANPAARLLNNVECGKISAVFSSIGIIELLVGPKKRDKAELAQQYRDLIFRFPNLTIAGINPNIVEIASDLRAKYGIPTPDAIHIATAIDFGALEFFTHDKRLGMVDEIKVSLLAK